MLPKGAGVSKDESTKQQTLPAWLKVALPSIASLLVLAIALMIFKVPYSDVEMYTEKEPYTDENCVTKPLVYKLDWNCMSYSGVSRITVTNLDTEQGDQFTFWLGFVLEDGNKVGNEVTEYIYPLQSKEFTYSVSVIAPQCWQRPVTIPTKTVCTPVTNYNEVTKQRTVTKYQTLLDSIIHPKR